MPVKFSNHAIFIVGYIHTGTSLLKTILRRNPDVWAVAGETHFFQDLGAIKRRFPDLKNDEMRRAYILFLVKLAHLGKKRTASQQLDYSLADLGLTDADFEEIMVATAGIDEHEGLFGLVNDHLASIAGKPFWVEKTPEHVYYLTQLLRHLPDAKVVELVRDPRATLASRKVRRTGDEWLDSKEEKEDLEVDRLTNYDPVIDSMMWKEAINAAHDARHNYPQNILTIRYEDLAANPAEVLQRICRFTGLTYSEDMLDVGWVNAASQMKEQDGAARPPKAGVSTAAVEKWRKSLEGNEIFLAQALLKSEMREMGYQPAGTNLSAKLKAPVLLGGAAVNLTRRMGKGRNSPERAKDAFARVQRRLLKNLGVQR